MQFFAKKQKDEQVMHALTAYALAERGWRVVLFASLLVVAVCVAVSVELFLRVKNPGDIIENAVPVFRPTKSVEDFKNLHSFYVTRQEVFERLYSSAPQAPVFEEVVSPGEGGDGSVGGGAKVDEEVGGDSEVPEEMSEEVPGIVP